MNIDNLRISFLGHKDEVDEAEKCFAKEKEEGRLSTFNLSRFSFGALHHKPHNAYFSDVVIYDYVRILGRRRDYEGVWERGMRKRALKLITNKFARKVIVIFQQNNGFLVVFSLTEGEIEEVPQSVPAVRFYNSLGKEVPVGQALQALVEKREKFTTERDYRLLLKNI